MCQITKECNCCHEIKPLDEFSINKSTKDGLYNICKTCHSQKVKETQEKNKAKNTIIEPDYTKDKKCSYCGEIKKGSEFYKNKSTKDGLHHRCKKCHTAKNVDNEKQRLKTDSLYKFKHNTKELLRKSIKNKGFTKKSKTFEILGIDYEGLMKYIENQFDENMNWGNYGSYWQIDHIVPLSIADTEEEVLYLNRYKNLQPLEAYYNEHVKKDNIGEEFGNHILYEEFCNRFPREIYENTITPEISMESRFYKKF